MTDHAWESPVRARLRESKPVFGCTITTTSLDVAVRAARAGFDFLWLELEHSPLTIETVRNIVLATRDLPAVPIARVPETEPWTAKRVLDAGVHGVVFPFVSTPELARQAADACRYPPTRRRGSGASLATACWPEPDGYYDSADRNVVVAVDRRAGRRARAPRRIAATPGVDVVFVGTGDLSFRCACADSRHPRVEAAAPTCWRPRAPREDRRTAGRDVRRDAALHRTGLPVFPGAVRPGAAQGGRAELSRSARPRIGAAPAYTVLNRRSGGQERTQRTVV